MQSYDESYSTTFDIDSVVFRSLEQYNSKTAVNYCAMDSKKYLQDGC